MGFKIQIGYKIHVSLHILHFSIWRTQFENLWPSVRQLCYYMSKRSFDKISRELIEKGLAGIMEAQTSKSATSNVPLSP